jgi:Holliday junction resolvase RusA-like endonuclease
MKQPKTLLEVFTGDKPRTVKGRVRKLDDKELRRDVITVLKMYAEMCRGVMLSGRTPQQRTVIELGHLPDPDLSPNKRLHYMALYKAKAEAKQEATALVMAQGKPDKPYEKAHITVTWIAKDKRRRDIDNLFSSLKASIDALVAVGLLRDDDAMHVSYTLRYERGEKANTILVVEEIG